jgi:uncharacterized membrane protein YdbT with pleckstrin-like domain
MNVSNIIHLKDDEQVLRVVRNYWLIYVPQLILGFLLIAAALFLMLPLMSLGWYGLAIMVVAIAIGSYYGTRTLVIWYWNVFIITNLRIVDVNQYGFFRRTVAEVSYDKVQDITYSIDGFWHALFNFGVVHLETAGGGAVLELLDVHDPKEVNHLLTETMGWHKLRQNGGAQNEKVAELLATVSSLKDSEAKAFLVAIQQAVTKNNPAAATDAAREAAQEAWAKDTPAVTPTSHIFRHDIRED